MKTDTTGASKSPLHSLENSFIVARSINFFTILFGVLIKEIIVGSCLLSFLSFDPCFFLKLLNV